MLDELKNTYGVIRLGWVNVEMLRCAWDALYMSSWLEFSPVIKGSKCRSSGNVLMAHPLVLIGDCRDSMFEQWRIDPKCLPHTAQDAERSNMTLSPLSPLAISRPPHVASRLYGAHHVQLF
jgi:hypothetical protein